MTRILLTGATGFIGSHLARLLVREGAEVYALVRAQSDRWRISDIERDLRIVSGDFHRATDLRRHLRQIRPELCLHLAWYTEPGSYVTSPRNVDDLNGTLRLVEQLAATDCRRFVGAGTCYEYDLSADRLTEVGVARPRTLYGAAKLSAGLLAEQLAAPSGMQVVWPRLFYQFGPGEDSRRLVPSIIIALSRGERVALTLGEQLRDFLYIADVAAALAAVARSDLVGSVNIGSGRPCSVRELALDLGQLLGRPELLDFGARPYPPDEPMRVCADTDRLTRATAWVPAYTITDALRRTVAWWQCHTSR